MEKIRIYYLGQNNESLTIIKKFVAASSHLTLIQHSFSVKEAIEDIKKLFPDILLIDESINIENMRESIQKIMLGSPYLGIIVATNNYSSSKAKKYMNIGVRDLLIKPFTANDLVESVQQVFKFNQILKQNILKNTTKILTRSPKMISVFSTKGGVGKSTVSTIIATGLRSLYKEETVIVDLDLQFGDISLLMDIKPKSTITNAIEAIMGEDIEDIQPFLSEHPMGVKILPSPMNPEEEEFITEQALMYLFKQLKEEFNYIIVDCPPGFTDQTIVALEQSDLVLFIASPELNSLKNTKNGIKTLKELKVDLDKVKVLLNRYSPKGPISLSTVEEILGLPVYKTISSDYALIVRFLNEGRPDLIFEKKGRVGKEFVEIIEDLRTYYFISNQKEKGKLLQSIKRIFGRE